MRYPIITGDGRLLDPDTNDYQRLKLLPEACEGIDPRLWEMFAEATTGARPSPSTSPTGR